MIRAWSGHGWKVLRVVELSSADEAADDDVDEVLAGAGQAGEAGQGLAVRGRLNITEKSSSMGVKKLLNQ